MYTERTSRQRQCISLSHHLSDHVLINHVRLFHNFDGIHLVFIVPFMGKKHFTECTAAYRLYNLKIINVWKLKNNEKIENKTVLLKLYKCIDFFQIPWSQHLR